MISLPKSFNEALADFGRRLGVDLVLRDGRCHFVVDGTIEIERAYVEEPHVVIAWTTIGLAPEDEYQGERARALLALNAIDAPNGGFTVAMDPETRRVVAHDNRPAELFDSADRLAAWIGSLVDLTNLVRREFEKQFPCADVPFYGEASEEKEE